MLLLAACVSVPTPGERRQAAVAQVGARHWHGIDIATSTFNLQAFIPDTFDKGEHLTVYLEGDGFAWVNGSQPSSDPTPVNPVALRMALAQPSGNATYLARPCQYVADPDHCHQRYWTKARFAEEVVASLDQAVDKLKAQAGARHLTFVGYSGGGALALLLAARRDDVRNIITVAGNLDPAAWTEYHHVSTLDGSLNPVDQLEKLARIPQLHLSGANDSVIPPALTTRFVAAYPKASPVSVRIIPGYTHSCCWAQDWPQLWPKLQ
ncbi:alpha/beta fold hydrolase [Pseudomonas putida]|uniref:Alpha/beta fold hydrolase n=2 Tax=Pseudomonas putida TaxID=303 RepID=A0A2Z4RTU9_PSEPU|nr:alpha/beta fold hydrolase [Pseudomonas putida]